MEFLALMWNLARFQYDTKSGRFILPTGRSGDLSKFRESPGESGRLNMYVYVIKYIIGHQVHCRSSSKSKVIKYIVGHQVHHRSSGTLYVIKYIVCHQVH